MIVYPRVATCLAAAEGILSPLRRRWVRVALFLAVFLLVWLGGAGTAHAG